MPRVRILHRRDKFHASKILQERVLSNEKIEVLWNTVITEIEGEGGHVTGVRTTDTVTGEEGRLATDGVFIFVGHLPNNDLFPGKLEMDEDGHLITDRKYRTNVPGVFAARRDSGQGVQAGCHQRGPGLCGGHVGHALPGRAGGRSRPRIKRRPA